MLTIVCKVHFFQYFFSELIVFRHLSTDFTTFLNVILSDLTKRSLSFNTNTQEARVTLGCASQTSRVLNTPTYER